MSLSPIRKALSSIRKSGVKTLLMGGQACVLYGAAEFSREPLWRERKNVGKDADVAA